MQSINVALIGQGFMGRSHSNAWGQVARFLNARQTCDAPYSANPEKPQIFADNWVGSMQPRTGKRSSARRRSG